MSNPKRRRRVTFAWFLADWLDRFVWKMGPLVLALFLAEGVGLR